MASIKIKAFVHKVDDSARGFIYAKLFTERGTNYVRISSADDNGKIQVYVFGRYSEMMGDAENQTRLNDTLVRANEDLVSVLDFASKRMLVNSLREQHSYLFREMRFIC